MRLLSVLLLASFVSLGCEDEPAATVGKGFPGAGDKAKKKRKRKGQEEEEKPQDAPPRVEFQEEDFMETERSRDPFRSFAELFEGQGQKVVKAQRTVVMSDHSLDELRLIGIVSRIQPAKAMLVAPGGRGYVVHRGDFVGKAERVQGSTPGADYQVNWRLDKIRATDLVFIREDPSNPDVPTATRVIALREEAEKISQ